MLAALARLEAGQTQLRTDLLGELASTRPGIMERLERQQAKLEAIDGLLEDKPMERIEAEAKRWWISRAALVSMWMQERFDQEDRR